jgi:broad specificity phosphatase PhoE
MTESLHPEETLTRLLLVRHGQTAETEKGKLYSNPMAKLTELGTSQIIAIANWISKEKPNTLLSSAAHRVVSSAQIIEKTTKLKAVAIEDLNEWHVGNWEGLTYLEVKKNQREIYDRWVNDPIHNAPPDGESIHDVCQRVQKKLLSIIKEYEGKTIILVTHAGVIRAITLYALSIPIENFWRLAIPVGSISKIDFSNNFATVHYLSFIPD